MKRLTFIITAVVFLLLSAFGSFVFAGSVPGVDDNTIKLGILTDFSGPGKHPGNEIYQATKVWVDYVNDRGGIHGRKLELYYGDHGWDPSRGMAEARRLVTQDNIFALVNPMGSSVCAALTPFVMKEKLPMVAPMAVSSVLWDPPKKYIFCTLTSSNNIFQVLLDYIVEDLKVKKPKVAIIYQDDAWGKDAFRGLKKGAQKHSITLVAEEPFKRGAVDYSSQVLNCKKAGADYIFVAGFSSTMASSMKEAAKLEYKPLFLGDTGSMTTTMLKLAGPLAKDHLFGYPSAVEGDQGPGMKKLKEITDKYRPNNDSKYKPGDMLDPNYIIGYHGAMLAEQGLRDAGRELTREKFVTALENLKNFESGGLFGAISFGQEIRNGGGWTRIYKADPASMTFIPITDFRK